MPAAPLPVDEDDRLAELEATHILDSPSDARFDSFVKLAADLFEMPIALVSLVDERRQWFKATHGLDISETPRDYAFCSHAILTPDEVLVVEDATRDPRFADSPLVCANPRIRFYAGATIRSPSGRALGTLCVIDTTPRTMDVQSRQRLQALAGGVSALLDLQRSATELRHAASYDSLTGIANRAMFDRRLERAIADQRLGRPCALILLDMDGFKQVNDTLGHMAGDALLRVVASRLQGAVRSGDLVARFGGDEFAILMGDPADDSAAAGLAGRITASLGETVILDGTAIRPLVSAGVALCPRDAREAGGLLRAADMALYRAKRDGGGQSALAGGRRTLISALATTLEADFAAALDAQALEIRWSPYVDVATDAMRGYEALPFWDRPGHGAVELAAVAKRNGSIALSGRLDSWLIRKVCQQAARWPAHLEITLRLSADWFGQGNIANLVIAALSENGVAAERLCVAVQDPELGSARDRAGAQMATLRATGVRVALADFGAGSPIGILSELPFDVLRLNRTLISGLGVDDKAGHVAACVLALGRRLGMRVCAEGVESEAQLAFLRREGCALAQGSWIRTTDSGV